MAKWSLWLKRIEALNDRAGRIFSFLLIPLMVVAATEVILRYIFNSPTIWAWDVNIQLFGALIIFGGAYAFRHNMHVRVDLLVVYLPRRARAVLDLITSTLFFFSFMVLLVYSSLEGWNAFKTRERFTSIWAPPIYPLKMLIPVAIFLFILQGVVYSVRDFIMAIHPEAAKEK